MTKQTINVGSSGNDGTGDKLRVAFTKVNDNFTELYTNTNGKLANTSGVTFAGDLHFPNTALVGLGTQSPQVQLSVVANGASQISLPGGLIDGTGNTDLSIQLNIRNNNPGTNASSDIVATNDTGTDYIDFGIDSSNYNNPYWTITGPGDGYIFTSNNNLVLGTLVDGWVKIFTNGQLSENEIARFGNNKVGILTNDPQYELDVNGGIQSQYLTFTGSIGIPNVNDYIGERILVWNNNTANVYNYSIGIQQDAMWFGVDTNANSSTGFIWYSANNKVMELGRNALLTVNNSIVVQNLKGPYANDSSASTNGVGLREFYYDASGVVRIRLS